MQLSKHIEEHQEVLAVVANIIRDEVLEVMADSIENLNSIIER